MDERLKVKLGNWELDNPKVNEQFNENSPRLVFRINARSQDYILKGQPCSVSENTVKSNVNAHLFLGNKNGMAPKLYPTKTGEFYICSQGYWFYLMEFIDGRQMEDDFEIRLQQVVRNTLETDILQFAEINVATARKLKQLLAIISQSVPFKPNMSSLATMINAGRNNLADYFLYMEEAGLIAQLRDDTGGIRGLGKVDKVYLDNTNLVYVLGEKEANIGNVRETFFFNQLRVNQDVMTSSVSDFQIGNRTFEVGGKNKKQKQLQGVDHGFVVKDDIETGYLNVIPLWMFGLNY